MKGLLLLCGALLLVAGCQVPYSTRINSAAQPDEPVLIIDFPKPFPVREVRGAVLASLEGREWEVGRTTETSVRASLIHRGFESNIQIEIESSRMVIYSDSWRIDRQGERLNPEHPDGWLRNIEHDVRRFLGVMDY